MNVSQESSPFAAVILDGDGAVFRDDLLAKGHEGGVEAAHMLFTNVKNQLKNIYPKSNIDDWSIVVQIAMSLPGLGNKLLKVGIIPSLALLADFVHGFNYSQPLFSIVDVGKGDQRADGKCREMARLMARIKQCKHMFFGPCHDRGYIPPLQTLRDPFGAAQRVTLVETIPALPGFKELKLPFTKLTVFRSEPLPDGQVSSRLPPVAPQPRPLPAMEVTTTGRAATSGSSILSPVNGEPPANGGTPTSGGAARTPTTWAALSKNGAVPNSKINIAPKKAPSRKFYLVNKDNERVDEELPRFDPAAEKRYQARKAEHRSHCNEFHLKGECDPKYCPHYHGTPLPKAEALVLRHKARSGVCNYGSECDDPDCYYGHHCRYGRHCTNSECRFGHLHHVDLVCIIPSFRGRGRSANRPLPLSRLRATASTKTGPGRALANPIFFKLLLTLGTDNNLTFVAWYIREPLFIAESALFFLYLYQSSFSLQVPSLPIRCLPMFVYGVLRIKEKKR
ncbi:hypothetical protein CONLIGDRAFT_609591 [Coniochaeta ligniaria NRRL 30616]|uniref:C3H1-type domain-containing protein n=1 Tax=Coniochaeta ligniaria NRRL 30616 TaxID=1408157 RepID=A0A1J7IZX3_9PEZI|nr:hypothetical protein CONLIGDRAFT_609591 [Coniochaeta ligniaria NRRL 30616]